MTSSINGLHYGPLLLAVNGFQESDLASDPGDLYGTGFCEYNARCNRYALYWSFYEGNIYRRIHRWSRELKERFDLYPAIRTIYSTIYRQTEFWAGHIWGGTLDPEAGDGKVKSSALPIAIPETNLKAEPLRAAIAQLWAVDSSDWQTNKEIVTRLGTALGDVFLMVVDDGRAKSVRIQVIHPRSIRSVDKDASGSIKGYVLEEERPDPRVDAADDRGGLVGYREVADRIGESVRYRTYIKDGADWEPFDWRTYRYDDDPRTGVEWTEDYGFIPLFHIQHRNMSFGWGWAELHPTLSKHLELDDAASVVGDKFRQAVNAKWFFAGMQAPKGGSNGRAGDLDLRRGGLDLSDPDFLQQCDTTTLNLINGTADEEARSARNDEDVIYCSDPNGKAQPLVAPLDLAAALNHLRSLLSELERDHPELQADMATSSGDASGRALRVARERVEAMVSQRRTGYDNALVRAHQAAVSIGAMKGYEGFEDFDGESFYRGDLDHSIGDRPVFAVDAMDRIEEHQARANACKTLTDGGWPLDEAMVEVGYSDDRVKAVRRGMQEREARQREMLARVETGAVGAGTIDQ